MEIYARTQTEYSTSGKETFLCLRIADSVPFDQFLSSGFYMQNSFFVTREHTYMLS